LRHHTRPPEGCKGGFPVECTAQADGLLHGTERLIKGIGRRTRSLENAARDTFGLDVPKALQTSDWSAKRLSDGQLAYAATDAVVAWRLWLVQKKRLKASGRLVAYTLQRDVLPAVADMQLRGLRLDRNKHAEQVESWKLRLAEARREYHELTGQSPPATDVEVRAWVERTAPPEKLLEWRRTEKTGEISIAEVYLKRLALLGDPTVKLVLKMRSAEKLLRNFGPKLVGFIHPVTARIHADYMVGATKAGRFSAKRPNLQQLPAKRAPDFKGCIVPALGHVLVGCDFNQIEMRAAAWISGDRALTAVYAAGRDLHVETAAIIAKVPVERVTPEQREGAKPVNYGAIYGVGPLTLAENAFAEYEIEMSEAEAQAALERFFVAYHGFNDWRWDHWHRVKNIGRVRVPGSGRTVERGWEYGGRIRFAQACNIPVQGIAADCLLRAIKLVYLRWKGGGGLVACLHDELLMEVPEAQAEAARVLLEESMLEAFVATFPKAPIVGLAEAKVGRSWKEVK
jgi:DNA polymerase I-like protein with 3'-5' exonuclease and polymerase domains